MLLLLVCTGLFLAYAIGELVRGAGPAEGATAAQAPSEPEPAEPERVKAEPVRQAARPAAAADAGNVFYQYVDGAHQVQFARSLEEVPAEWRARAGRVSLLVAPPAAPASPSRKQPARAPAVRHSEGTFSAARSEERRDQPEIEIYTTKSCGYCRAAMAHMDKRGLEYTNHDIEEEPEYRDEYLEKTGGRAGVPVIDIEGEIMQGWNREHFETVLASMRQ